MSTLPFIPYYVHSYKLLNVLMQNLFTSTLRLFVRVADPSDADAVVQVIVTINDINDNHPSFQNLPRALPIDEVRCL